MPKISLLPAATASDLKGTSKAPVTDAAATPTTVGATFAQLRTSLLAQGTGYATTDALNFGTTPPTGAAVNVDASSFTNLAYRMANGTASFNAAITTSAAYLQTTSAHGINLGTNSIDRWNIPTGSAGTSYLVSSQAIALIRSGATSWGIENSGASRTNFTIADSGATAVLTDGTNSVRLITQGSGGELVAGGRFDSGNGGGKSTSIVANGTGTTGDKVVVGYYNQTQYNSALEVANVASGFGTISFMQSGGYICEYGTAGGGAQSNTRFRKLTTAIADNTATTVLTITVPNVAAAARVRVTLVGIAGAGGAIGAYEDVTSVTYDISVARTVGVAMGATASTGFGSAAAVVVGAGTMTTVGALTLNGEGVGATNTASFKVTIDQSSTSTNHRALVYAEVLNDATGGVTIS